LLKTTTFADCINLILSSWLQFAGHCKSSVNQPVTKLMTLKLPGNAAIWGGKHQVN